MSWRTAIISWLEKEDSDTALQNALWEQIKNNHLFLGVSFDESQQLAKLLQTHTLFAQQKLNLPQPGRFIYFVLSGQIALNKGRVQTYGAQETCNLLALAEESPLEITATTDSELILLDGQALKTQFQNTTLYNKLMQNLSLVLSIKLAPEHSNTYTALEILLKQIFTHNERFALTQCIFKILMGLALYQLLASIVDPLQHLFYHQVLLALGILGVTAALALPNMLQTGVTIEYGLNTKNGQRNILQALWLTFILILAVTLYKYYWLQQHGLQGKVNLLNFNFGVSANGKIDCVVLLSCLSFALLAPLQELLIRSGLQVPLYNLLEGNPRLRMWLAIICANLLFLTMQAHATIGWILIAFLPGMCWGLLFHYQQSLVGVMFSRTIFSWYIYYLLDLVPMLTHG